MQAFTDVPVQCCDCKKTFLSASSLLQHFAQHVKIKLVKTNYEKLNLINKKSSFLYKQQNLNNNNYYKKDNNITENVSLINIGNQFNSNTNTSLYTSPVSSSTESSLQSIISDKSENISNSELSIVNNNNNNNKGSFNNDISGIEDDIYCENAQHLPSKLSVLQETQKEKNKCLNKSARNIDSVNNNEKKNTEQFCVEFNSEKLLINIEKISSENNNNAKHNSTKTSSLSIDVFNNIKNGNECNSDLIKNNVKTCSLLNKRKLSNRKQLVPKKIERTSNGLIKIAPRPEDMTVDYVNNNHNNLLLTTTKNTPKKKYNCHLCSKVFGWSTDLKRHILVHTGERPFKCSKCSACFTRNFLLQKHKSKIHPCYNKEIIEKNKLLELKVNENLKELKNKMYRLENKTNNIDNFIKEEDILEEEVERNLEENDVEEEEEIQDDFFKEEMIIEESKFDIEEELLDPLACTDSASDNQKYVNGNWILSEDNNKFLNLEYERKENFSIRPIINMSS